MNQTRKPTKKKKKIGSQSNPQKYFPTHIIFDILSRLPIKTLFSCRRVCKEWLSLISDPHFAKLHLSVSQVSLLVSPRYESVRQLNLVDLQIAPHTSPQNATMKLLPQINLPNISFDFGNNILNSCNGFLCLCDPNTNDPIYVCNPILGELITLPKCPNDTMCHIGCSAVGFCPKTNQYKVLRSFDRQVFDPSYRMKTYRNNPEAEIYTLGEGSWRSIGFIPTNIRNRSFNAFLNGALHWLTFCQWGWPDLICCFDFESEQFRGLHGPPGFTPDQKFFSDHMRVGVLRGCLSICDYFDGDRAAIWLMKDYGIKESWSKDFVIPKMSIASESLVTYYEPIMILESGKILMLFNTEALFLYDPKLESYEDVQIHEITSKFHGIGHVPSLVSLRDVAIGENVEMCRA